MLKDEQRQFREKYRVLVMYVAGASALVYCARQLQSPTWEWLLVVPVMLAGNFVEWAMHRYVMHRRMDVFALRAIYERHTREHHQSFTDTGDEIDSPFFRHLFNGYSEKHVRAELRPVIERFRQDDSHVTLDGAQLTEEERRLVA